MKRKWIKRLSLLVLTPIVLFLVMIVCLYIPSVQNLIQRKAMLYISEATGMDISIRRVDLRFPLDLLLRDVVVVQKQDTILKVGNLKVRIQALPLIKKKIKLDELILQQAQMNTQSLVDGMRVNGVIGTLQLDSREIDLENSFADLNKIDLRNTDLTISLCDSTIVEEDSVTTPIPWRIQLGKLKVTDCNLGLEMPLDSTTLKLQAPSLIVSGIGVDLLKEDYSISNMNLLESSLAYHLGTQKRAKGLDINHIVLDELTLETDSVHYNPSDLKLQLSNLQFKEQSGIELETLRGRIHLKDDLLLCDEIHIKTPYSFFNLSGVLPLLWCHNMDQMHLNSELELNLKELATVLGVEEGGLDYSDLGMITCKLKAQGDSEKLLLQDVYAELSDSFMLTVDGVLENICDNEKRIGQIDILADLYDLSQFNNWLADDGSVTLPLKMTLQGFAAVRGNKYLAELLLQESSGIVDLKGKYNAYLDEYEVEGKIDSLSINRFLAKQPLSDLSLSIMASGKGLDFTDRKSMAKLKAKLNNITYEQLQIRGVDFNVELAQGKLNTELLSDNDIVKGKVDGYYYLNTPVWNLGYQVALDSVDLYKMGVVKRPLKENVSINAEVIAGLDSILIDLKSGDLNFNFIAKQSINQLLDGGEMLLSSLIKQLENKQVDYKDLQKQLPEASLKWQTGNKNLLSSILRQNNITYLSSSADFSSNPYIGMKGWAGIEGFKLDSLDLDSVSFELYQDTLGIRLESGFINTEKKDETAFRAFIRALLGESSAKVDLDLETGNKNKGLLFGVEINPTEAGTHLILTPDDPTIAFKKFKFRDKKNWLFLREDMRVFADIDMQEERKVGFKMHSNVEDTVSIQNMNIDIRSIELNDITRLFPFLPQLDGIFSAEAHYIQSDSTLQVSTELSLDDLQYEKRKVGDIGMGITWLPDGKDTDLINMYLTHNRNEVLYADGLMNRVRGKDYLDVEAHFEHFPLNIANVLFPNEEVRLGGDIDGYLHITGLAESPIINGELVLDSVAIYSKQAGAKFLLDSRPVPVKDSKIIFKDFSIYTTSENPFKINGSIDITNLSNPIVNLKLEADDYTLLNAKRTKESILYGKLFVDVNATLKGPVEALKMRGNMSILDDTNLTYVLTESPLTVQDRLGDLVTFTSFRDSTAAVVDTVTHALGGLDMVMSVHIDPSVLFKVDLSADRSSRIELQGGGDLSLQYTPQGEFYLTGRYALSDGIIKYSLPVIPAKEFKITNDSYIEWNGKVDNPKLNLLAQDRVRASVSEPDGATHMANFDVIIGAKNRLDNLELLFDVKAPENASIQNQLASMGKEERSKQAIGLLATGVYLAGAGDGKGRGIDMGVALNSVLQSQINAIAGSSLKNASISVGVEEYDMADTGAKRTDYSFRYSQRFLNNRFQLVLGGRIKTGVEASNDFDSFIDNVSLEYRLDSSGTRFVRVFHNKNYESVLEGEITETGVGIVLRKKLNRLSELFIFKKKKKNK